MGQGKRKKTEEQTHPFGFQDTRLNSSEEKKINQFSIQAKLSFPIKPDVLKITISLKSQHFLLSLHLSKAVILPKRKLHTNQRCFILCIITDGGKKVEIMEEVIIISVQQRNMLIVCHYCPSV